MQSLKIFALVGLVLVFLSSGCAGGLSLPFPLPGQASPAPVETTLVPPPVDSSPTLFVPEPGQPTLFVPEPAPASPTLFIPPTVTSVPLRTPTVFVPATAAPSSTVFVPRPVPATVPATRTPPPGVYIQGMRIDPKEPKQKQDITFYVSFINSTGKVQEYRWFIFIYPEGAAAPIGQTSADKAYQFPPGVSEFAALNTWRTGGGQPCVNYVAKVHWLGPDGTKPAFTGVNGKDFDLPFMVCA